METLRLEREAKRKADIEQQSQQPLIVIPASTPKTIEAEQAKMQQHGLTPKETRAEKWSRNNPDLEKFIGENLVSKIGIAILVLAIGFL